MTFTFDGKLLYSASMKRSNYQAAVSRCNIDPSTGFPSSCAVMADEIAPEGFVPVHMAADPNNTDRVVILAVLNRLSSDPQVMESVDGGSSWDDITVAGSPIDKAYSGQAVTFLSQRGISYLVVGTSEGVYVRLGDDWELLAVGLPNVAVWDMVYTSEDDKLVIATLGRGVWHLSNAFYVANIIAGGVTSFSPIPGTTEHKVGITINLPDLERFPPDEDELSVPYMGETDFLWSKGPLP